jgi:hypothetical protein
MNQKVMRSPPTVIRVEIQRKLWIWILVNTRFQQYPPRLASALYHQSTKNIVLSLFWVLYWRDPTITTCCLAAAFGFSSLARWAHRQSQLLRKPRTWYDTVRVPWYTRMHSHNCFECQRSIRPLKMTHTTNNCIDSLTTTHTVPVTQNTQEQQKSSRMIVIQILFDCIISNVR